MTESKGCYVCGAVLDVSKKQIVLSYWKVLYPKANWYAYICNECKTEDIDFPFEKKELVWLKIRTPERSKFH